MPAPWVSDRYNSGCGIRSKDVYRDVPQCSLSKESRLKYMAPSIWSTDKQDVFAVSTAADAEPAIGHTRHLVQGWVIVDDPQGRPPFEHMYDAANALAGVSEIAYEDFYLGKGEQSRTVRTSAAQIKAIAGKGHWKLISASAPRCDDVN